jgi:hypothetical protein
VFPPESLDYPEFIRDGNEFWKKIGLEDMAAKYKSPEE